MNSTQMEIGKHYVVTKASDDGTFEVGDHIALHGDGSIMCREAQGWIDAVDVPDASKGMEVELDMKWVDRQRQLLQDKLGQFNKMNKTIEYGL